MTSSDGRGVQAERPDEPDGQAERRAGRSRQAERRVGLVWAQAANGVIGRGGALPWRLPEDMARFRELTAGSTVVMGRRTWESIAPRYRPLPGRRNLVLTRDTQWAAPGAETFPDLAVAIAAATGDVWVIGGAQLYAEALDAADVLGVTVLEVTELADPVDGDVHAPVIPDDWLLAERSPPTGWHPAASGLRHRFTRWERRPA